jgi:preprotein translocase subunit YajC
MKLFETLALMPPTPAGTEPNPTGSMLQMLGMFAILGVMFYFLMIRPQQKQRKEQENMLKNLKTGDKVVLTSGILGIIANVKEKTVTLKVADNVKIEVLRSSISGVTKSSEEPATTEKA